MASSAPSGDDEVASSLSSLKLHDTPSSSKPPKPKPKKKPQEAVVDSWEDEEDEEPVPDEEAEKASSGTEAPSHDAPAPESPPFEDSHEWRSPAPGPPAASPLSSRRPEKTDAVARRMIAAGLGLKAPKQTEEQKAYHRSIREQERKRREQEKAEEQRKRDEADRARAAVWDD
ncbi:hypothetical protein CDD83_2079 [Cordyceps sp. RAO-2017]|nr:hypothetical protein CDD83_2079 [Cordyceps sp. RAO-2017]